MLTFEGQKISGSPAILQKLTSLPFQQCQHRVSSLDAQPSVSQGVNIFVTGQLIVSGPSSLLAHLCPPRQPSRCDIRLPSTGSSAQLKP